MAPGSGIGANIRSATRLLRSHKCEKLLCEVYKFAHSLNPIADVPIVDGRIPSFFQIVIEIYAWDSVSTYHK